MYEIKVQNTHNFTIVAHRFSEFNQLDKLITKKFGKIGDFPDAKMGMSSTNSQIVKDRKVQLEI